MYSHRKVGYETCQVLEVLLNLDDIEQEPRAKSPGRARDGRNAAAEQPSGAAAR